MAQTNDNRMVLKSQWGTEFIFIEDFPYYGEYKGEWTSLSMRDASNAQKFTQAMLAQGLAGETFSYSDVLDWISDRNSVTA